MLWGWAKFYNQCDWFVYKYSLKIADNITFVKMDINIDLTA